MFAKHGISMCIIHEASIIEHGTALSLGLLAPTGALVLMMVYYLHIRPLFQIFTQSLERN